MGMLTREYEEWNNPAIGAFLLWRFSLEYERCSESHASPPFPLHCIAYVLLQGHGYEKEIERVSGLHEYVRKFVRHLEEDKLDMIHNRIMKFMPYVMRSVDFAVARGLLAWNLEDATLTAVEKRKKGESSLPPAIRDLAHKADRLGSWMSELTLQEIALDLGVRL